MRLAAQFLCAALLAPLGSLRAEPVTVRYTEGVVHGFLVLRASNGQILADGDLSQVARGDKITSKLVFRFRDGSYNEETAVFSQSRYFQLVTDHLVQKGPSFPHPLDMSIDTGRQQVTVRYTDDDGKEKIADEHMDLPADLTNGIISILLKNLPPEGTATTLSTVAATPKPRLVKLAITRVGEDSFANGRSSYKASHFLLKVELGGVAGVVAPLVGKQPPDNHVWILTGDAPAFLKSEAPFYPGGPSWRIELASPVWPRAVAPQRKR
jgi:hypothetical protein